MGLGLQQFQEAGRAGKAFLNTNFEHELHELFPFIIRDNSCNSCNSCSKIRVIQ